MNDSNRQIIMKHRIRPIRLAFLVRPSDKESLIKICKANTCLWGGMFNGIIPVFDRTPNWWGRKPPTSQQILNGYIGAFEPDYLVETKSGLSKQSLFEKDFIISIDDILSNNNSDHIRYGINMIHLYEHLYDTEYRFIRKEPIKVVLPKPKKENQKLFSAAAFGLFPQSVPFRYFSEAFQQYFDAKEIELTGHLCFESHSFIHNSTVHTPLMIGTRESNPFWHHDPILFYMNHTNPNDIIDFWNLRALGRIVVPVPKQFEKDILEDCRAFGKHYHRPHKLQPTLKLGTCLLKARSVSKEEFSEFANQITSNQIYLFGDPHHYPRIWDERARDKDGVKRGDVKHREFEIESVVENERVRLKYHEPEFNVGQGWSASPRWVDVIKIEEHSYSRETATVFPRGIQKLDRVLKAYGAHETSANSEGIVLRCKEMKQSNIWTIPDGVTVFKNWLKQLGYESELSDKGKIAQQMIRSLKGLYGVSMIAHREIIDLLEEMSRGTVEETIEEDTNTIITSKKKSPKKKTPIQTCAVTRSRIFGLLNTLNDNNNEIAERHFEGMINSGIMKLGLRVECPICKNANWHALSEISDILKCDRCINDYQFPIADPPMQKWRYRTQGSFSIEKYAQGSYTVLLTLKFITSITHHQATWVPNMNIKENNVNMEFDFAVLCRESFSDTKEPKLLIGEAKSYNDIEPSDIKRARDLIEIFPNAIIVFSTLKDGLSESEKKRISKLAYEWRRKPRMIEGAPVMILTANEMLNGGFDEPPECWHEKGGKFDIAERIYGRGDFRSLCDATQFLYLDMEPFSKWQEKEHEKKIARYKRKKNKEST